MELHKIYKTCLAKQIEKLISPENTEIEEVVVAKNYDDLTVQ